MVFIIIEVPKMKDKELIDLYLCRNENAIAITKEQYGKRIRQLLYGIIKDYDSVEDCENDCYYNVWKSIPPNTPYNYFFAYITTIARNIALNFIRSRNRHNGGMIIQELDSELENTIPGSNNISDLIDAHALSEILNSYVASLPESKRNIFIRRYWYMDSVKEISKGYRISVGTVKSVLFRCRNELKSILIKEGYNV
jgi:RNA polymerase sigma-70 factor (ECF subfamily)